MSHWWGVSTVVAGMLVLGVFLSGCRPPAEKPEGPAAEPVKKVEDAEKIVEQPAEQLPAKPAEPPAEPPTPAERLAQQPAEEPAEPPKPTEKPAEEPAAMPVAVPGGDKLSDFAPADDLAAQAPEYIQKLEDAVKSQEEYNDSKDKIGKGANTLVLIALGLGLHEQDNKYKASAAAMMKAAGDLAAAKDYGAARAAVDALKAAAAGQDTANTALKWEKVASLKDLMLQVPLIHTKLKRYVKGRRFESKAADTRGMTAVIAVIAHGSMANASETEKPHEAEAWRKFCVQMRDAAAAVNAGIRARDRDAATTALKALNQSCDDCHAVFYEEAESQQ